LFTEALSTFVESRIATGPVVELQATSTDDNKKIMNNSLTITNLFFVTNI
jgi:hypothetical protein